MEVGEGGYNPPQDVVIGCLRTSCARAKGLVCMGYIETKPLYPVCMGCPDSFIPRPRMHIGQEACLHMVSRDSSLDPVCMTHVPRVREVCSQKAHLQGENAIFEVGELGRAGAYVLHVPMIFIQVY